MRRPLVKKIGELVRNIAHMLEMASSNITYCRVLRHCEVKGIYLVRIFRGIYFSLLQFGDYSKKSKIPIPFDNKLPCMVSDGLIIT